MIWTLLALLSMVILGGFISYYGDLQGRRWGKRRVSWFGLRPKHTAILITSLTGSFIALFSVLTLLLIAPTVREVVLEGERAIRENKRLTVQSTADRITAEKEKSASQSLREVEQRKLADTKNQLKQARALNSTVQTKNQALLTEQTGLQRENANLSRQKKMLMDQNRTIVAQNKQLKTDNITLAKDNVALTKNNKEMGDQSMSLARNNADLLKSNAGLTVSNKQLAQDILAQQSKQNQLRATNRELDQANAALKRNNDAQYQAYTQQATALEELNRRHDLLLGQMAGSERDFTQAWRTLREGQITLRTGEMIARRVIPAHLSAYRVREELTGLLDDASAVAMLHGAARGENGRAACIVGKRIVTLADQRDYDEQASLNALVDSVANSDAPVLVTATVVYNTIVGEQALVELSPRAVGKVFDKGALVASIRIDARRPFEQVLDTLVQFLQKDVRDAAINAGVVPQIDADTGAQKVGSISPRDILLLTENVMRKGGDVVVSATTRQAVMTGDPLLLDFKLSRPHSGS